MLQNQKNVFWEALIITVFIFGVGILIGIFIENSRTTQISDLYLKSEINLLDVKLQTDILNLKTINCDNAVKENINFGNRIYEDASLLQQYEDANRITNNLVEEHRKYDLLRTTFWINSIKIKEKCGVEFHTVVYVYDYSTNDNTEKSKQYVFSKFLEQLKADKGDKIVLIPLARNLNLSSITMLTNSYSINQTSIIVDEKLIVTNIQDLYKISDYLN